MICLNLPSSAESIAELLKEQQQILAEEKPEKPAAARYCSL